MTAQDYSEALDWLYQQMPNYQVDGKKAYKPGLDNIKKLCEYFGNPHQHFKSVHIAGTNGKGSTSNMIAAVLQEAGYKVGLYNSPHLIHFTERIKVNGTQAHQDFVFQFIQQLKQLPKDIRPSFFEFTTVMAFEYFKQQKVDIAIIETGLGGRLDATNLLNPILTAITNVALDHQDILGDTLEKIAVEKAGIIKPHIPIISGEENPNIKAIFQNIANSRNAPFIDATTIKTVLTSDLKGNYQRKNIKVALAAIEQLRNLGFNISDINLTKGLQQVQSHTGFIGRWYEFSREPLTICDTGHNQAGLEAVLQQLKQYPQHQHIVLGFVKDKKVDAIIPLLPKEATYYFVTPAISRGQSPKCYEPLLKNAQLNYRIFNSVDEGYIAAKALCKAEEMIFIGGSNFVVGEFLEKNLSIDK